MNKNFLASLSLLMLVVSSVGAYTAPQYPVIYGLQAHPQREKNPSQPYWDGHCNRFCDPYSIRPSKSL